VLGYNPARWEYHKVSDGNSGLVRLTGEHGEDAGVLTQRLIKYEMKYKCHVHESLRSLLKNLMDSLSVQ
jgi:hypothetical protein